MLKHEKLPYLESGWKYHKILKIFSLMRHFKVFHKECLLVLNFIALYLFQIGRYFS